MVFMVSAMLVRPTACLTDCMLTHTTDRSLLPLEGSPPNGMPDGLLVGSLIALVDGSPGALIVSLLVPSTHRLLARRLARWISRRQFARRLA